MSNNRQELLNNGAAVGPQGEGRESPSRFPKYPAYKDSGVEWMGEVPAHWNVAPVGMYYKIRNGFPFSADNFSPEGVPEHRLIRIRDILGNDSPLYTDESCPVQCIVENGDILIGMDGDFNIASWAEGKAKLNQRVCAIRGSSFSWDRFFFYGIGAPLKIINDLAFATTVKHLASSQVLKTRFPIPPEIEVDNIARFLDYETARIDALIEEQQRLIELLKEKRQAVISHAVTKGLNPDAPMKDSGVEWLGEVPAHWESLTLGRVASSVKTGGTPSDDLPSADIIDGVEWYTPGDFTGDLLLDSSEKRVSAGAVRSGDAKVFPSGSVLIVSIGATLGKVGYIRRPASANQQINAVVPGPRVDGYFLAYSLSVKVNAMRFLSNASTIGIMNQEKTKEIWLSLPPLQEQKLITEFLDKQTSVVDTLIQEAAGGVALLQERRSALISAAVTGKIDVRNW